jgi:hypothetical protein
LLLIPADHFTAADVSALQPPDRAYDLALSLEVAEHLPHEAGPQLVRYLTQAAPQVLFSAAVPGQGGVGHINEHWLSYWAGLFKEHGYLPLDALRPQIWHRSEIAWWYRQNLMLFIRQDRLPATYVPPTMVDVVQPELVTRLQHQLHESQHRYISGKEALGHLLSSVARRIGFR